MSLLGMRRAFIGAAAALWLFACDGTEFQSDGVGGAAGISSGGKSGSGGSAGSKASGGASSGGASSGGSSSKGGSSAGGAAGSVSTGGSGGSVVSACPTDIPQQGSPCSGDAQCSYGDCCPTQVLCSEGAWQVYPSACPEPICPPDPPLAGDDCKCLPDNCRYDMCALGGSITVAQCRIDGWEIHQESCDTSCGGQICPNTELCLVNSNQPVVTYSCQPDPCPDNFSCDCLAPMLCPGLSCLYADPATRVLSCTCPNCG